MSAVARIAVGTIPDMLLVPTGASFQSEGRLIVYRRDGTRFDALPVEIVRRGREQAAVKGNARRPEITGPGRTGGRSHTGAAMTGRRLFGGVTAVVLLALVAVGAVRVGRNGAAAAPPSDPLVPTTRVTRGPLELSVHANGELRASKSAMLIAPSVGGTLRILRLLDAGVSVKAGDVIAEFDPTEQQYALEQARSELEEAEQQIVKKKA